MSTTEEKMFVPKDGKATIVRFVDDPSFHHIRPPLLKFFNFSGAFV